MTISEKTTTQAPADACKIEPPTQESRREFLLATMRCERIRAQLFQYEIDEIALAVKYNMVTLEFAIGWLDHVGALDLINSDAWRVSE